MNQNISRSIFHLLLLLSVLISGGMNVLAQQTYPDLNVGSSSYTIGVDEKREFQNVFLDDNSSVLTVNGTLIVYGNLDMVGNQSQFIMGPDAKVIIYGDFLSSNSVSITAKSYLIIYGNFINNTPSNKAELTVDGGNIYIFGTVDNWGNQFTTCEDYAGDTDDISAEQCDYGTEDDFEDNLEDFPDDLTVLLPCITNYKWTGSVDSNWNNTNNWSCEKVPGITTNVIIPAGTTHSPILQSGIDGAVKNIVLEAGASLAVINRQLSIAGSLTSPGTFISSNGSVAFVGTNAQTIPAGVFLNGEVKNLLINNLGGVTSQATIKIINSLKVENGEFFTGGDLTLVSTASGTAFVDGSGSGKVTGTVKMQRYLSSGFGYKYFSSPFTNSVVGDFSPFLNLINPSTGFHHFFSYDENRKNGNGESISGWEAYTDVSAAVSPGRGYAANLSEASSPVTVEIAGEVNNGNISLNLQNNSGIYTKGFNLVGNPYPSPIDWSLMVPTLSGIDDAVYFFKAGIEDRYTGTYSSYVNGVSTGLNTTIIPSMQGFFVKVSNPGTASLDFTNAARTGNQVAQNFYQTKNHRIIPQIKLAAGFSGKTISDATVIYFQSGATTGFEKELDALKLLNTATEVPSLYSLTTKQEKLSINAISAAELQEIPLGLKTEKPGKMFLELTGLESIFPAAYVYLKDEKNNLVHNFSEEAIYSFTSPKGENNERFSLILSSEKLSEKELKSTTAYFSVNAAEGEFLVKLNLSENTSGNVILSNISGQILQKRTGKEKEEVRFTGITTPGVYLVTLEHENERQTRKVLLKK